MNYKYINKDKIWYMLGSICNAASSALLFIVVTRISGINNAGLFSIAFAFAQQLLIIGRFEVRSYQITDVKNNYSFSDYFTHRVLFCTMMMAGSIIFILIKGYSSEKFWIILLLCCYKCTEAFSDVFQGFFQKENLLKYTGITMAVREIIFIGSFTVSLIINHSLIIACLVGLIFSIIWIFIFDIRKSKMKVRYQFNQSLERIVSMTLACFPIFLSVFANIFIINLPKYTIDQYMENNIQSYYNMLFLPTSLINLFSMMIFFPMMTELANLWYSNARVKFALKVRNAVIWIIGLSVLILIGGYLIGIPMLTLIYNVNLSSYKQSFMILLIGGGFGAIVSLTNKLLVLLRKQYFLIIAYIVVSIVTYSSAKKLILFYGIMGSAMLYLLSMCLLTIIMLGCVVITIRKGRISK